MATIKSYTDIEQSKKLAEILPLESADMRYGCIAPYEYSDRMYDGGCDEVPYPKDFMKKNANFSENEYDDELPCWSLAALLNILQPNVTLEHTEGEGWKAHQLHVIENPDKILQDVKGFWGFSETNPIDAVVELIVKLKKEELI